ncbi:MAG: glycosyltransferase [bacterium]
MPEKIFHYEYFNNAKIDKPLEQIWKDLQEYSGEIYADEPQYHHWLDFWLLLPPLWYDGKFVKGLLFSQGIDFLHELHPELSELFFSVANSMCNSYPWSEKAEAYFTCYKNPAREKWFRSHYPEKKDKLLLPTQDADYTNERVMAPTAFPKKDIDVLCISRLDPRKNLGLMAESLAIYRKKYNRPLKFTWIIGKEIDLYFKNLTEDEIHEFRIIEQALGNPGDYIELIPLVNHFSLPQYYSRAKTYLLTSLLEGKNRTLHEALCCDTPLICFQALNQFTRGKEPAFPEKAGLYVSHFDAESLADTIHTGVENYGDFKARYEYMKHYGRWRFFNRMLDAFAHFYEGMIPDFKKGDDHTQNAWLDAALQTNYQLGTMDFIYDKNPTLSHTQGVSELQKSVSFYVSRWNYFKNNPY